METLDDDAYENNIKQLQRQLTKHVKNKAAISSLMVETAPNRRKWIVEERPSIHEVTNKFPALKDYDMVHIYIVNTIKFINCTCIISGNEGVFPLHWH